MAPLEPVPAGAGGAASAAILSGPEDSIFDCIFDWIQNAIASIISPVTKWIRNAWTSIVDAVEQWALNIIKSVSGWWQNVLDKLGSVWSWAQNTYNAVRNWVASAYNTVASAVSSVIGRVSDWIVSAARTVVDWITSKFGEFTGAVGRFFSSLWTSLSSWFSNTVSTIAGHLVQWAGDIKGFFTSAISAVSSTISGIWDKITASFDWLAKWLLEKIPEAVKAGFDFIINKVLDFPAWIGKLFDAIGSWVTRDIPGHSPWWHSFFDAIGHWFGKWFYDFPRWFFGDFAENVAYGLGKSFEWVTRTLSVFIDNLIDGLLGFVTNIGPVAPSMSLKNTKSLLTIATTAIVGLGAMTVAGELLHPLKQIGLGNLAAMIYDLSNYRLITAAFFGALTYALIRLPSQWYYYYVFRPQLPSVREGMDFYSSDDIGEAEFRNLLGYHGLPNEWHDGYVDSSFKPPSPFQLATVAESGAINETVMMNELRRAGFHPDMRQLFIDSFKKSSVGAIKTVMVSAATSRFKEGITDEAGLVSELKILNVGDQLIPLYVAGAKLQYATDYVLDLVAAYTTAVTSGNMSIEEYRAACLSLGIVPERVEAGVLKLKAKLRPKEKLTPIGAPGEIYLTDRGRLQVDTLRIRRTKNTITRAQELNSLAALGMPADYAASIADNDDAKLLERVDIEPAAAVPLYKTDAGKVKLDSVRDSRRKNTIDASAELAALAALGVPEYLAVAMVDNDTIALEEKTPTAAAPAPPLYETEAGKIKVDTIRRSRRKGTITRAEELAQLAELNMPEWLRENIVENDDIRLTGKAEGE